MKHRLQGDKKALRLRQGFRLRAYERFAETRRRDRLQAMSVGMGLFLSLPTLSRRSHSQVPAVAQSAVGVAA